MTRLSREQAVWAAGGFQAAMVRLGPVAGGTEAFRRWNIYRRIRNMIQAAHAVSDREAVVAAREF